MYQYKYVFAQLIAFLDRNHFNYLVRKYAGDKYVKHFTCWNQLLTLMFGQLSNRESMRDLIIAIEAHHQKCYHLGFGKHVTRSNLSKANTNRDYRIFEEYAYYLVSEARRKRATDIFKLDGNVYAFDSTTISLCLDVFWWAKFRKHKGGIKIHTLYDLETQIPAFFHITTASVHDSKAMKEIPIETGAYYIFDRGYNNFKELYRIHRAESFFVVRAKTNLQYKCINWKRRMPKGIRTDAEIELTIYGSQKGYPEHLRLVRFFDEEQGREFMFLTNAMELTALQVADLYKNRWQIELFFYDKFIVIQSKVRSIPDNQMFVRLLLTSTSHNNSQCPRSLSQSRRSLLFSHSLSESRLGRRSAYAFSSASRLALESALA